MSIRDNLSGNIFFGLLAGRPKTGDLSSLNARVYQILYGVCFFTGRKADMIYG